MDWQIQGNPAEVYERYLVPAIFVPMGEGLIARAAPKPGERVLDVACGTGIVSRLVAPKVGNTGRVVGVDINATMLSVARSITEGIETVIEWREGDVEKLPFADGSFDFALCQQALQFFPDRLAALQEIHRVLVPGGRLILNVFRSIDNNLAYRSLADAVERHVSLEAAKTRRDIFALNDPEELRALFNQAGYSSVTLDSDVYTVKFQSAEHFLQAQLASWKPEAIGDLDEPSRDGLVRDINTGLRSYVDGDGLAFPIDTHLVTAYR